MTRDKVRKLLEDGKTGAEIARQLGLSPATVSYHKRTLGFPLKSWYDAVQRGVITPRPQALPLEEILRRNRKRNRYHVKSRLMAAGLKTNECEECGLTQWRGEPLSLALHHINGDGTDNRLENLVLLCPNCHSQTPNFGVKNVARGRRAPASAPASATPSS